MAAIVEGASQGTSTHLLVNSGAHPGFVVEAAARQGCVQSLGRFSRWGFMHFLRSIRLSTCGVSGAPFGAGLPPMLTTPRRLGVADFWDWIADAGPVLDTLFLVSAHRAKPSMYTNAGMYDR